MRHSSRRPVAWAVLAAAALPVGLAACGSSNYRYVNSAAERTYIKLPRDWKVFEITADDAERPKAIDLGGPRVFRIIFDASTKPAAENLVQQTPQHPVGELRVVPLSRDQRDAINRTSLRAYSTPGLNADPLEAALNGDPTFEIVNYEQVTTGDGLSGDRTVFNHKVNDTWVTTDFTQVQDLKNSRAYVVLVRCVATCFKEYRTQINQVVESWQVRK